MSAVPPSSTASRDLPIKIWRNVFRYVRAHSQNQAAQMPLLCRALRAEAESVLYHQPQLTSLRAALVFADIVSAAPHLARWVRIISFSQWPDQQAPMSANRSCAETNANDRSPDTQLCKLVGLGLKKVMGLSTILVRDHRAMRTIAAVLDGTNIRVLYITGDHLHLDEPTVAFLKTQQRLKELRLYHRDGQDFDSLGLRRVRILSCSYSFLSGLGAGHLLTHLNVTSVTSEYDIAGIIRVVGPRLVSLRLEQSVWKQRGRLYPTNGHDWDRCPMLRFLQVRHCLPHANVSRDFQVCTMQRLTDLFERRSCAT